MRGVGITCLAVRQTDGTIYTEQWGDGEDSRPWYKRTPIIRGGFNFIEMMVLGYKCLMKSAELAGFEDEEPSAFEKKLASLLGDKFSTVMTYLVVALGVALAGVFYYFQTAGAVMAGAGAGFVLATLILYTAGSSNWPLALLGAVFGGVFAGFFFQTFIVAGTAVGGGAGLVLGLYALFAGVDLYAFDFTAPPVTGAAAGMLLAAVVVIAAIGSSIQTLLLRRRQRLSPSHRPPRSR